MLGDPPFCGGYPNGFRRNILSLLMPQAGVKGHAADEPLLRYLGKSIFDAFPDIADGGDGSGLPACVMLVISHENHVIRHNPLFFYVVERIVGGRDIVVDRKHQSLFAAGHGQLTDELYVMNSGGSRQALEI